MMQQSSVVPGAVLCAREKGEHWPQAFGLLPVMQQFFVLARRVSTGIRHLVSCQ
jgi:hypothetical protein